MNIKFHLFISALLLFLLTKGNMVLGQHIGLFILVKEHNSLKPVEAEVKVRSPESGEIIREGKCDLTGTLVIDTILSGLEIIVEAEGFMTQSETYIGSGLIDSIEIELSRKIMYACPVVIDAIYFDYNSFELAGKSDEVILKLKEFLKVLPDSLQLEIRGRFSFSEKKKIGGDYLSYLRVISVYEQLSIKGTSDCKLTFELKPAPKRKKDEEEDQDRKVDFYIIKKKN